MVRASDLWSKGREFDSRPFHCRVAYVNSAFHTFGVGKTSTRLRAGVRAGRVYLCRVADNTVWSHMAGDVPYSSVMGVPLRAIRAFIHTDSPLTTACFADNASILSFYSCSFLKVKIHFVNNNFQFRWTLKAAHSHRQNQQKEWEGWYSLLEVK